MEFSNGDSVVYIENTGSRRGGAIRWPATFIQYRGGSRNFARIEIPGYPGEGGHLRDTLKTVKVTSLQMVKSREEARLEREREAAPSPFWPQPKCLFCGAELTNPDQCDRCEAFQTREAEEKLKGYVVEEAGLTFQLDNGVATAPVREVDPEEAQAWLVNSRFPLATAQQFVAGGTVESVFEVTPWYDDSEKVFLRRLPA